MTPTTAKPETKQFIVADFEVKAKDESARTFEGYLNTWELDEGSWLYRDKVHPGAFKRWVTAFNEAKKPYVPLIDSHGYGSIMNVYGHLLQPEEQEKGLWTKWQVIAGNDGQRVFDRLEPGSVRKMSMGYTAIKYDFEDEALPDGRQIRNLREVKVEEGSLVVFAMNSSSEVTRVKALLDAARSGSLTEEQKAELRALLAEPAPPAPAGLAPDDPQRIAMEEKLRDIQLRSLATRG